MSNKKALHNKENWLNQQVFQISIFQRFTNNTKECHGDMKTIHPPHNKVFQIFLSRIFQDFHSFCINNLVNYYVFFSFSANPKYSDLVIDCRSISKTVSNFVGDMSIAGR